MDGLADFRGQKLACGKMMYLQKSFVSHRNSLQKQRITCRQLQNASIW